MMLSRCPRALALALLAAATVLALSAHQDRATASPAESSSPTVDPVHAANAVADPDADADADGHADADADVDPPTPTEVLVAALQTDEPDLELIADALGVGANPNAHIDGEPAIAHAAARGWAMVCELLCDWAARPDAVGDSGQTALHAAIAAGSVETVYALLDWGARPSVRVAGRTALHTAATTGSADIVDALLLAGADATAWTSPTEAEPDQKRAETLAADAGHDTIVDHLLAWRGAQPIPDDAIVVSPDDDLQDAIAAAADGATLVLEAGEYAGPIQLTDKRVNLRGSREGETVIACDQGQVACFVARDGSLEMDRIKIKATGATTIGVAVQQAQAALTLCAVSASSYATYVQTGALTLNDCRFDADSSIGAVALEGSQLAVFGCAFDGTSDTAIAAQGATHLIVARSTFHATPGAISVQSDRPMQRVAIRDNVCVTEPGSTMGGPVIRLQADGPSLISNNVVVRGEHAIYVLDQRTSAARVVENVILNTVMGIFVNATPADDADDTDHIATLARNTIVCADNVGILVRAGGPAWATQNRVIVDAEAAAAVGVVDGGTGWFIDNVLASRDQVLLINEASELYVEDCTLAGRVPDEIYLDDRSEALRVGMRLTNEGTAIREAMADTLAKAAAIDGEDSVHELGQTLARLAGAVERLQARTDEFALIGYSVEDMLGETGRIVFDLYQATGPDFSGGLGFTAQDVRYAGDFMRALAARESDVLALLWSKLPEAIRARISAALQSDDDDDDSDDSDDGAGEHASVTADDLATALDAICNGPSLHDPTAFATVDLSPLAHQLLATDLPNDAAQRAAHLARLNRVLLEDALPDFIVRSRPVASGYYAFVPPGAYWLVPRRVPTALALVRVAARDERVIVHPSPHHLWLQFYRSEDGEAVTPDRVLVSLRSRADLRRELASTRLQDLHHHRAWPRAGATPEQVEYALALARRALNELERPNTQGMEQSEAAQRWTHYDLAFAGAHRVLGTWGTAADAAALVAKPQDDLFDYLYAFGPAAAIEARLDVLATGALNDAVAGDDKQRAGAAAMALMEYGVDRPDVERALLAYIADRDAYKRPYQASRAIEALYSKPDALDAVRAVFEHALADEQTRRDEGTFYGSSMPIPITLYLLAWGERDDIAKLAALEFGSWAAPHLFAIAHDPLTLGEYTAINGNDVSIGRSIERLRALPHASRLSYIREIENLAGAYAQRDGVIRRAVVRGLQAPWRPDVRSTDYLHRRQFSHDAFPWMPWGVSHENHVNDVFSTAINGSYMDEALNQLDYFPTSTLEERLSGHDIPWLDLILASHRTTTRASSYNYLTRDGVERRPYALLGPDGAISGVMELRPRFVDDTLYLRLRINQVAAYERGDLISANAPPSFFDVHAYVRDNARAMLTEVRLIVGDEVMVLEPQDWDEHTRSYVFVAQPGTRELAGMRFEVESTFFEQQQVLAFDMWASDLARDRRRTNVRIGVLEAIEEPTARVLTALARLYHAVGRVTDALATYDAAIAAGPTVADAWQEAAAILIRHDRAPEAAALLARCVVRFPDDPVNWGDLAAARYEAGEYRKAVTSCDAALARAPGVMAVRALRWTCLFLAGERARVAHELVSDDSVTGLAVATLRYLATASTDGMDIEPAQAALQRAIDERAADNAEAARYRVLLGGSLRDALNVAETSGDRCQAHAFAGYAALLAGNAGAAQRHFGDAIAQGATDRLEHRMATLELERLQ